MGKKTKKKFRNVGSSKNGSVSEKARSDEFDPDYSYVIKDLKRIGILAGLFFALLIGLSFVL